MNELLASLDAAVADKVVIFGSTPPEARDLDLLARPLEEAALRGALQTLGFGSRGATWARFRAMSADVVDVVPAQKWRLSPEETDRLFGDAVPLEGFRNLARPASHDVVLITALRAVRSGQLDAKRRQRVTTALVEDPGAWDRAATNASAWRAGPALTLLRRMYEGEEVSARDRSAALATLFDRGRTPLEARARSLRHMARGTGKGRVIALSGLDGAGKSTQAAALVDSLQTLGHDAVAEWTRLAQDPSLDRIARPVKKMIRLLRRSGDRQPAKSPSDVKGPVTSAAPERGRVITFIWSHFVALENARTHRRAVIKHLRAGRVVVCDRYVLDSHVHLRRKYPELGSVRSQATLVRLLSPRALRSYLLFIDAAESVRRKDDVYSAEQLERHAALYLEIYPGYGTRLIDGTRPPEDIAADIAREVWTALDP